MTAAVLSLGTELTRGEIHNTNATWLAEELTRIGLDVTACDTVADDREAIADVITRLGQRHDAIVCTGGLGPTTDDITAECVATVLGEPLVRDQASFDVITERMKRFGRTVAASNAKQADFPRSATILANAHGTAPGFSVKVGRATLFCMPGVPGEMKPMFATHVEPALSALVTGGLYQVRLKTFGLPESAVNDRLAGIEGTHGVVIAYRAHFPEIEVKVLARGADAESAERVSRAAADEVRAKLADVIYAEGNVSYAGAIGDILRQAKLTFATAESCTGGLVAELLTDEGGASDFFRGAVVSYDNAVKTSVLGVSEATLAAHGAVSREVAHAMAEGARRVLGADVALSITGIAGPNGGTETKPVGLVHFAVATRAGTTCRNVTFPGSRKQVRTLAAYAGLALVRKVVREGHDTP